MYVQCKMLLNYVLTGYLSETKYQYHPKQPKKHVINPPTGSDFFVEVFFPSLC